VKHSFEQRFLERIKAKQQEYAHEGLAKPHDKSEFGFGRLTGVYSGLLLAEQLFLEVAGEEDDDN
jgi:hypothetical protein